MKISSRYTSFWSIMWGAVMVLCGGAVVWGGNTGTPDMESVLNRLSAMVEDVDPLMPVPENDGKAVRAVASLQSTEMLEDEFLKAMPWLILDRQVEMFQWSEKEAVKDAPVERGMIDPPPENEYQLGWFPNQIDFFAFRVPEGHENPALPFSSNQMAVKSAVFGGYDGNELLKYMGTAGNEKFLKDLTLVPEILKVSDAEIIENTLYIRHTPGMIGDNLGDVRIRYRILEPQQLTVIARQTETKKLSTGRMDGNPYFLVEPGDVSLSEMLRVDEQGTSATRVTLFGGILIFFGLVSVLLPFAGKMDLRPTADLTGRAAVLAVSAVITVGIVLLMMVGAWLKGN